MDSNLILTTKLYPPPVTLEMVPRTELLERLERNAHRPLTLISAPAGYGKSVLASMWLEASGRSYGWVSLDEYDNDLPTFVAYVLAAVEAALPEISLQQSRALLELAALPAVHVLARYLLNDLDQIKEPFFLALDDIHVIREYAIFELLTSLLEHPPPDLHLIVIGRSDPPLPIAALSAYGQISEIRARDLRFDAAETAQFLRKALDQEISDPVAAEWAETTEGWAVALRLAAISILSRGKTVKPGVTIQGRNQYLQEYLVAEVLALLSPIRQACLLKISLLDRFCAPLCEVVCQELDGVSSDEGLTGETFMQWLQESDLFLIALDDNNEWFRFHHLFQSYLRNFLERQLSGPEIAAINSRAGKWFADNDLVNEAIRAVFAAGDRSTAVDIFSQHRYALMDKEYWFQISNLFKLFADETVRENPVLLTTGAVIAFNLGRISTFFAYHQQLEELLDKLPAEETLSPAIRGEVAVLTNLKTVMSGSSTNMIENAQKSLEMLPPEARHWRDFALSNQIGALQMEGRLQEAEELGKEVIEKPTCTAKRRFFMIYSLGLANFMEGELIRVLQHAGQLVRQARQTAQLDYFRGCYFLGVAHYLRNELDEAEHYLLRVIDQPELTSSSYVVFGCFALMSIYHAQDRLEEAATLLQKIKEYLENAANQYNLETLRAFQVEFVLMQGQIVRARRSSLTVDFDRRPILWFHYVPQLTPIKLMLHEGGRKNLEQAQIRLKGIEDHLRALNRKMVLVDVLALQALVCYAMNNVQEACEKLRESLFLAQPGGAIRNYVDLGPQLPDLFRFYQQNETEPSESLSYAAQIVAAFPKAGSDSAVAEKSPSPPQLTKREMEILKLLATDLSPDEIAEKTFISVATARTHIRNVYAKLDAHSRFEAVQNAEEVGLL